jgi:hypothetical protein
MDELNITTSNSHGKGQSDRFKLDNWVDSMEHRDELVTPWGHGKTIWLLLQSARWQHFLRRKLSGTVWKSMLCSHHQPQLFISYQWTVAIVTAFKAHYWNPHLLSALSSWLISRPDSESGFAGNADKCISQSIVDIGMWMIGCHRMM